MAARVSIDDVKAILDNSKLTDPTITAFITSANIFVNSNLGSAGLGEDLLFEIERWLAAHMISVTRERTAKKEGAGGASIEYTGEWGKGLSGSSYGQTAIALDSSGTLTALSEGKLPAITFAITSPKY